MVRLRILPFANSEKGALPGQNATGGLPLGRTRSPLWPENHLIPIVRKIDCVHRAAVVIKPVSADSLRKTGIFADKGGDFRRFPAQIGEPGVRRRNRMREKPGFPAHSRVSWEGRPNAGMAGWRRSADRTRLHANSLLTGNLTGNFAVLGL
jgi:hypothetical protein